jgi:ribonucleoside-diphosphate reductase alpha chain
MAGEQSKRPATLFGLTTCCKTPCGPLYLTLNHLDDGILFEAFVYMGKGGWCASAQSETMGRLVSYALKLGGDPAELIKQLSAISCSIKGDETASSCADAVAKALKVLTSESKAQETFNKEEE